MSGGSFIRSGLVYGVANIVSAGVPFALLPILTRALEPAEYGEIVSFYMLVALCTATAGLGLQAAVAVRWLDSSKGDPRTYTASATTLVLLTTAITAVFAAVLAPAWGLKLAAPLCALAAILAGANVVQAMRFAIWQSRGRAVPAAVLQVAGATLNIALSLLAVFTLRLGGEGRMYGATVAGVVGAVACLFSMFSRGVATCPVRKDFSNLLRFGIPLMPHALAGVVLANADRFAVAAQMNAAALGVYGTASQLGLVINVIADAAIKAYTPFMYGMLRGNSPRSRLRVVAIAYLSVPFWLCAALIIWAFYGVAGRFLLGAQYQDAIGLAIWFLLGGAVMGVYLNIAGLFFFTGRTEWISVATVSSSLLAMLVAAPAVQRFGVVGGGATYFASQVVLCVAAWALSRWTRPMPWGRPLLAGRVLLRSWRRYS